MINVVLSHFADLIRKVIPATSMLVSGKSVALDFYIDEYARVFIELSTDSGNLTLFTSYHVYNQSGSRRSHNALDMSRSNGGLSYYQLCDPTCITDIESAIGEFFALNKISAPQAADESSCL